MRVLVTGSSGRIGRAIVERLRQAHEQVRGLDRVPGPATDVVGDLTDAALQWRALQGVDALVHTAALHAPHVGQWPDEQFEAVNVRVTSRLATLAAERGLRHLVFTSTTALYGAGPGPRGEAAWLDEDAPPSPRTVYHRSKYAAETALATLAAAGGLPVTVLRMSRCFPEPADRMAVYRLHRGVDARDVAQAHALALRPTPARWRLYVVSHPTPFDRADALRLGTDAAALLRAKVPALAEAFSQRGWALPASIDRVYDSHRAVAELGWRPRHGWAAVLAQAAAIDPAVLPAEASATRRHGEPCLG